MSDKAVYAYPQREHQQSAGHSSGRRYMPIRKNACIVCGVCFTCSKYYADDCACSEIQPRRGKNLPEGTLDSRAKKLHPQDKDDYEFSIKWLTEHAHDMHKNMNGEVVGLTEMAQVSLCKAHSSTLYRAQKKHERSKHQLPLPPPSICPPPEFNGYMEVDHYRPGDYQHHHPHPQQQLPQQHHSTPFQPMMVDARSNLAAKARTLGNIDHYHGEAPDLTTMSSSTSLKRKRLEGGNSGIHRHHSSASTPLLAHPYTTPSSPIPHVDMSVFSSMHQLPPLQQQQPSLSQAPSPRSHSASISSLPLRLHQVNHPPQQQQQPAPNFDDAGSSKMMTSPSYHFIKSHQQSPPLVPVPFATSSSSSSPSLDVPTIDTVSLKSANGPQSTYYIRNLAITDTFTFRDLLMEVDMIGKPPNGKRIVISDERKERFFPMDQAIRSVVRRPAAAHVEFCLGLKDIPSIDWSTYTS